MCRVSKNSFENFREREPSIVFKIKNLVFTENKLEKDFKMVYLAKKSER